MKHSSAAAKCYLYLNVFINQLGFFSFYKKGVFLASKQNSEEILSSCI